MIWILVRSILAAVAGFIIAAIVLFLVMLALGVLTGPYGLTQLWVMMALQYTVALYHVPVLVGGTCLILSMASGIQKLKKDRATSG